MSGGDDEKQLLHLVLGDESKGLAGAETSDLDALDVADIHAGTRCFIDHSHRLIEPGAKGSGSN